MSRYNNPMHFNGGRMPPSWAIGTPHHQRGIGLLEVVVALVLLAIAVLGFSAMQLVALKTTNEASMRARAMTIIRGGAETIRGASAADIAEFVKSINTTVAPATNAQIIAEIKKLRDQCTNAECTATAFSRNNGAILKLTAAQENITVNAVTCPGTNHSTGALAAVSGIIERQCLIAAWGDTNATLGSGDKDCGTADGTFKSGANCFIVETY